MEGDQKRIGSRVELAGKRYGGNRKSQTFRFCKKCQKEFGPLDNLKRQFCSKNCAYKSRFKKKRTMALRIAVNAQRLLKYYVDKGKIIRGAQCEHCNRADCRIEAAHYDYKYPLKVKWLCRSCHVKWDKLEPKGGSVGIAI